jgi:hypothetical protein
MAIKGGIEIWYSDGTGDGSTLNGLPEGWYWWSCWPGCLPDSDPYGPFKTHNMAYADAYRNEMEDCP